MRIHYPIALLGLVGSPFVNGGSVKVHSPLDGPCTEYWKIAGFPEKDQSDPVCEPGETPSKAGSLNPAQKALFLATKYPDPSRTVDDLISHIWGEDHVNHPYARQSVEELLTNTGAHDSSRGKYIRRAFREISDFNQVTTKNGLCKEVGKIPKRLPVCASCPMCTGDLSTDLLKLSGDVFPYVDKFVRSGASVTEVQLVIPFRTFTMVNSYGAIDEDRFATSSVKIMFNAAWITYLLSPSYSDGTGRYYKSVLLRQNDPLFKAIGYADMQLGTARARYNGKKLRAEEDTSGPEALIARLACDAYFVLISDSVLSDTASNPICDRMKGFVVKSALGRISGEVVPNSQKHIRH